MDDDPKRLSTRIQMLATLVATATYAAGFNPPGGVWQDIHGDAGHLPGDPIMRSTHRLRYAVFFYCNAVAFTLSLIVVTVTLFVTADPDLKSEEDRLRHQKRKREINWYLVILMAAAMVAFTVAFGAGACRTKLTIIWYIIQVPIPFVVVMYQVFRSNTGSADADLGKEEEEYLQAFQGLMVPLSMFALAITYVAGLSTPGGFWDTAEGGHRPGDAILGDRFQGRTLTGFLTLNTTAFLASLDALSLLIAQHKKRQLLTYTWKVVLRLLALLYLLVGLLAAYIVGSSRGRVNWLLYGVVLACMVLYVAVHVIFMETAAGEVSGRLRQMCGYKEAGEPQDTVEEKRRGRRASLVQLMAGLAVAITYQAGLYPPGGLWPSNADGHMAGDPILLTTNAKRHKGFYYCNSVSFVASLLAVFLSIAQEWIAEFLHEHHALEAAMILDMLGLVGAYAIGSCRDQVSTLYVAGLAGAGVVYVFVHVSYFTLGDDGRSLSGGRRVAGTDDGDQEDGVEHMGGRFLLFAVLVASMTYQAGLTPPGGFLLTDDAQSGHRAGDPVLLYNYPRRYRAFFYCNSLSFMLSVVLIVLLVNNNEYRPAIKSHALSVCSGVSYVCLMAAFAAGGTQHLQGSYSIFVLAGLPSLSSLILFFSYPTELKSYELGESSEKSELAKRSKKLENLMTLAILVASATYPSGLDPPGGSWPSSSDGHEAGNPVMHDSRRQRYLAFFVANTASFLASNMLILMLLLTMLRLRKWRWQGAEVDWRRYTSVIDGLVFLQCLGFLVAYAAGSSRKWKTSAHIGTLLSAVLLFVAIHVGLSVRQTKLAKHRRQQEQQRQQGSSDDVELEQTAPTALPITHCKEEEEAQEPPAKYLTG